MISCHPYPVFIPAHANKLIIGSLPPERFCLDSNGVPLGNFHPRDVDFYYGSKDNHFWKILSDITHTPLDEGSTPEAIAQRKQLLTSLHCGITDIIKSCERINGSASDSQLKGIIYQPILQLLQDHSPIDTLIYTSSFVQQHVYRYFTVQLGKGWHRENTGLKTHTLFLPDRIVKDVTLYSPSPQALKGLGKGGKEKRLHQYQNIFTEK